MIHFLINAAACLAGLLLARWMTGRGDDLWANFLGICAMMMVSAVVTVPTYWLLAGAPVFLFLLFKRSGRKKAAF